MNYIIKNNESVLAVYTSMAAAEIETEFAGEILALSNEELAGLQRQWRDAELKKSDWIVPITDHPERESYLTYRASLRNWPVTEDFPNTKPTL